MVIGEYTRNEDLEVNIVREKKLTNMRKSTGDELIKLTPPTILSLEQSLEFCAPDECVEAYLGCNQQKKAAKYAKYSR